jgi:hypothetical protein
LNSTRPFQASSSTRKKGRRSATPITAQQASMASPGSSAGFMRRKMVYAAQKNMPTSTMRSPRLSESSAMTRGSPRVRMTRTPASDTSTPSACTRLIVSR